MRSRWNLGVLVMAGILVAASGCGGTENDGGPVQDSLTDEDRNGAGGDLLQPRDVLLPDESDKRPPLEPDVKPPKTEPDVKPPKTDPDLEPEPDVDPDPKACPAGEGRLVIEKDFCVVENGSVGILGDTGYPDPEPDILLDCDIESDVEVEIEVRKIKPKDRLIWEGFISEEDRFKECVPAGTYLITEYCDDLPAGTACLDEDPIRVEVPEGEKTRVVIENLIFEPEPDILTGTLILEKDYCAPMIPNGPMETMQAEGFVPPGPLPYEDCEEVENDTPAKVVVKSQATGEVVFDGKLYEGMPVELELDPGLYVVKENCYKLPWGLFCQDPGPDVVEVTADGITYVDVINLELQLAKLKVTKDYCEIPFDNGDIQIMDGFGWEEDRLNCKYFSYGAPAFVVIKDAFSDEIVFSGEIYEGEPLWRIVSPGTYVVWEACDNLPDGFSCFNENPQTVVLDALDSAHVDLINVCIEAPEVFPAGIVLPDDGLDYCPGGNNGAEF